MRSRHFAAAALAEAGLVAGARAEPLPSWSDSVDPGAPLISPNPVPPINGNPVGPNVQGVAGGGTVGVLGFDTPRPSAVERGTQTVRLARLRELEQVGVNGRDRVDIHDTNYALYLTVWDALSGASDRVTVSGRVGGFYTVAGSHLHNEFDAAGGPTVLRLGGTAYSISAAAFVGPGGPPPARGAGPRDPVLIARPGLSRRRRRRGTPGRTRRSR